MAAGMPALCGADTRPPRLTLILTLAFGSQIKSAKARQGRPPHTDWTTAAVSAGGCTAGCTSARGATNGIVGMCVTSPRSASEIWMPL